jgi:hypothetical protein
MSKGGGGSGGTQSTSQNNQPWGPAQPYLKGALSDLGQWYSSDYGRNPYPGSSVVPFNPMTETALGQTASRAMAGSPLNAAAQQQNLATQRGDYMPGSVNGNPYLDKTFDLGAGKVRSALDSQFNSDGGYGGSLHQGAMADNLNNLATNIYGGAYNSERSNQIDASNNAATMAANDYMDPSQLANVGNAYETQAGNYVKDAMSRWDFYQNQPYNRIQQLLNVASPTGAAGGIQTGLQGQQAGSPDKTGQAIGIVGTIASVIAAF